MEYQLRSKNPELMAMWFLETLDKLDDGPASWNQIMIEPDWDYDENGKSVPDWPAKNRMNFDRIPNGLTPQRRGEWFVERMAFHFGNVFNEDDVQIPRITND